MIKKTTFSILLFLGFLFSDAQIISGSWYGVLETPFQKIPLTFHIQKTTNGAYSALMDSPAQKAFGIKTDTVIFKNDSLYITLAQLNIQYAGKVLLDTAIHGSFNQGMPIPLNLNRNKAEIEEIKRPQTPKPPFSYHTKDTIYFNNNKSVQFGATLTYPIEENKKFPIVILITGSGQQDRNETLFEHQPFWVIADYLTNRGYAVLRIDDRGVGKTTGNVANATSADFAKDILAAIDFVKSISFVDGNKIGLLGHSEGGLIASMVAAQSKDVSFIISLAGTGVKGFDLLMKQQKDILIASEAVSSNDANEYIKYSKQVINLALATSDKTDAIKKATALFYDWKKTLADSTIKALKISLDSTEVKQFVESAVTRYKTPWFQFFLKTNPADYWSKISVPVLAINGEKDLQVAAKENINAIKKAIIKSGNKKITTVIFPDINHLFQTCTKCTLSEYSEIEETISPEVLKAISDWLNKNIKNKQ